MINVGDFAMLHNMEEAPEGLYCLLRTGTPNGSELKLYFRNEKMVHVEVSVSEMETIIDKTLPIPRVRYVQINQPKKQ